MYVFMTRTIIHVDHPTVDQAHRKCILITRWQILDSSKLKEFADENLEFHENERKLSKQVENALGKGEIACYEQFLLFPQYFQKAFFPKGVIVWEWVNPLPDMPVSGSPNFSSI